MLNNLQPIPGTRIVAKPAALDSVKLPDDALALRFAPDELFVTGGVTAAQVDDPYAIVVADGGFVGVWLAMEIAQDFLQRSCEWRLPEQRPAFAQGMVAGLAMKLWFEQERVLLIVPAPFAHDLQDLLA